ncbi:MAG: hypothetical protein ACLFQ6_13140, partial [Candidatus Sumerlaeia bacterium]
MNGIHSSSWKILLRTTGLSHKWASNIEKALSLFGPSGIFGESLIGWSGYDDMEDLRESFRRKARRAFPKIATGFNPWNSA